MSRGDGGKTAHFRASGEKSTGWTVWTDSAPPTFSEARESVGRLPLLAKDARNGAAGIVLVNEEQKTEMKVRKIG
jgi:hypothetical protein